MINMVLSQNRGTQYRPQDILVMIKGTPKIGPLILRTFKP